MKSVTPNVQKRGLSPAATPTPLLASLLRPWALPLVLVLVLSLLVGALAYQAPPGGGVRIGWPGDRLFLDASSGLGAGAIESGDLYPDDLTPDSPTGRSRWTREHATLVLPNLGTGSNLQVTLLAQGWPTDVLDPPAAASEGVQRSERTVQPVVTLRADDTVIDTFVPTAQWQLYRFEVPASVRTGADLKLELDSAATFTDTERGSDPRPKGIRLAAVGVEADGSAALLLPAWRAVGLLVLVALLLYLLLLRVVRSAPLSFLLTTLASGAAGIGLALARIWMGAALVVVLWVLVVALVLAWQQPLLRMLRMLMRRYTQGRALDYGLVAAALAWLAYVLEQGIRWLQRNGLDMGIVQHIFPDSLLLGLLGVGLLALVFVLGREGLPRIADGVVSLLGNWWVAPALLFLFGTVWFSYEAAVIAALPYVGHADYADNAVVARNLAQGRGWVVDYVSQFYRLYDGLTRPQETWPLLQPVWMAPFIALLGDQAWVAKLPNLLFNIVLLLLIYKVGEHIWDRRIGLTAAVLTLTNHLFFNLTIYTTSDLAFVVFSMGAVYMMYRFVEYQGAQPVPGFPLARPWWLVGSGVLTGLMMLQKPAGALVAVGIGLWLIFSLLRFDLRSLERISLGFALWAMLALLVLSPYLVRNTLLFGSPVYSTESYDAWVLGYRGDSGEAWNDIYRVFAPELGGAGLPDRSWILRWGFDYSYAKFDTQVNAMRDYLMPAWEGVPAALTNEDGRPYLFSRNQAKNLLMPLGAWLSLIGVVAALRARRRLLFLLFTAYTPYVVLLLTYWRANEERYFLMLMPWLALLAAWTIWAGYDRLASIRDRRWSPLALILVVVAIVGVVQPSWPRIAYKVQAEPDKWAPDVAAYNWIEENTAPGTVMMTRNPWQLNWHAERPAVMIPNTSDRDMLFFLAEYYGADYIVFENLQRLKGDATQVLAPLMDARTAQPGEVINGFELVYASPTPTDRVLVYRFPDEAPTSSGEEVEDDG
jgi:4-amino-4-deoxy-L-arabinose transferase-like glycosyltransferase